MELYLVRHGKTLWNEAGKLQGHENIALSSKGREDAGKLGEQMDNTELDLIYSSPLIRAYETASLIRGHRNIEIKTDDRLKEISFGVEEGSMFERWLDETSPYRFFFTAPEKYTPPENGETLTDLLERTKSFIQEEIEPKFSTHKRILITAHGALNAAIISYLENNNLANFWGKGLQKNLQATIFSYDGKEWLRKN